MQVVYYTDQYSRYEAGSEIESMFLAQSLNISTSSICKHYRPYHALRFGDYYSQKVNGKNNIT